MTKYMRNTGDTLAVAGVRREWVCLASCCAVAAAIRLRDWWQRDRRRPSVYGSCRRYS